MDPRVVDSIRPYLAFGEARKPYPAQWGRIVVPQRHSQPGGLELEVPFVRIQCERKAASTPVFYLNGGPGVSMSKSLQHVLHRFAAVAQRADLVIMEHRGAWDARPRLDFPHPPELPLDRPLDFAEETLRWRDAVSGALSFWSEKGIEPAGFNAVEMAHDVAALAAALGYDRVSLCGGSFGSHLAIAVMKLFPGLVERAALMGVEGPDHTIKLPSTVQRCLEYVAARAERSGTLDDLMGRISGLVGALRSKPEAAFAGEATEHRGGEIVLGECDVKRVISDGVGSTSFLRSLPGRVRAMESGDYSWLASQAIRFRKPRDIGLMPVLVDFASGATRERKARIEREESLTLLGGAINEAFFSLHAELGQFDLGDGFRADLRSDIPVFLVSGTLDGRTPAINAEEVMNGLPRGAHLVVDGVSHDMGARGPATDEIYARVREFLAGGTARTDSLGMEA